MDFDDGEAIEDLFASDVESIDSDASESLAASAHEDTEVEADERREMLRAPVLSICAALGGYEDIERDGRVEQVYRLGDDCLECLRDLRRLWRQDDTDSSRTIARVFAELGTLHNDLIPILLHTAGFGEKEDKIALACTDLITALTWPIDFAAEVRDVAMREDDDDVLTSLMDIQHAQREYKASVLRVHAKEPRLVQRNTICCVMRHVMLPSLAKTRAERNERDVGVIGMCLHLFRNLLAIDDPVVHPRASMGVLANATLQSVLVEQLQAEHVLATLMMLASNADTKEYEAWTPVVADCVYQVLVGGDLSQVAAPIHQQGPRATSALAASLARESRAERHHIMRTGTSRHSRFGTSLQFIGPDGHKHNALKQTAITKPTAQLEQAATDKMKRRISRMRPATERGAHARRTAWTEPARAILQSWADKMLGDGVYMTLQQAYLRDIHAERERVGDLDTARCKSMQLATFFLDYFLAHEDRAAWPFALVGAWLEPWAFRLARARAAISCEAKQWLEFVVSVRLWTALLRLLEALCHGDEAERVAADELQQTLYYDSEMLDTSLLVMHAYSAQSFACLEAVLDFAYTMPRLLQHHAASHECMFVNKRRDEGAKEERVFRFQTFQRAMATMRMAHVCTQYLVRWADSTQPQTMLPKLASVTHRLVVKAERPYIFFSAKERSPWLRLLHGTTLPPLQDCDAAVAANLHKLAAYMERKFTKLAPEAQRAFDENKRPTKPKADKIPADIMVREGLEHCEEVGIAMGLLAEQHKLPAVMWVKFALEFAGAERSALLASVPGDIDELYAFPPKDVQAQFVEHVLRPDSVDMQKDATRHPALKLLCRLVGLECVPSGEMLEWRVPTSMAPRALQREVRIMDQYLAQPMLVEGELSDLVHKARVQRNDAVCGTRDQGSSKKRKRETSRRGPKMPEWIDNEFIEDSEEEFALGEAHASSHSSSPPRLK
ncbi:Tof1p [Malassezia vespertilionis]|uniref:Tof1p n=1 Tax=Malassezia vespertilionis TaxID=2020962 RepID=A0A2N1JDN1_9BASI|nr:Tof1p [Malassezia vespertilionis]